MEENVALDSTKQKKFVRSIKKLIKKNEGEKEQEKEHKPLVLAPKKAIKKARKQIRKPKGLVYLSHIPHGFYEHQMTEYFKQFGGVTNVRVIRSKRTGNSKGCAFVEFKEPAVAEIVAETMNNYLMGKRIIKAEVVPPEKQKKKVFRMNWSPANNPGSRLRIKMKKNFNANKDEAGDLKRARKIVNNLLKTKKKLNEMGIEYDFTPVDVPDELLETVEQLKAEIEDRKDEKKTTIKENGTEEEKLANTAVDKKTKLNKNENTSKNIKNEALHNAEVNKKLKRKGISPLDSFIKINSDDDSGDDSSNVEDFDEQAYDKVMEEMDESSDSLVSDENSQEDSESENSSDESEKPPNKLNIESKSKGQQKTQPKLENKQIQIKSQKTTQGQQKPQKKQQVPVLSKKTENPIFQQVKRKAAQKVEVSSKKLKFEKNNEIKLKNKQFKKK